MTGPLRNLALRRELLVARSAAQRGDIKALLRPAALRAAAVQSAVSALGRALFWAAQLAPLYRLLRRTR